MTSDCKYRGELEGSQSRHNPIIHANAGRFLRAWGCEVENCDFIIDLCDSTTKSCRKILENRVLKITKRHPRGTYSTGRAGARLALSSLSGGFLAVARAGCPRGLHLIPLPPGLPQVELEESQRRTFWDYSQRRTFWDILEVMTLPSHWKPKGAKPEFGCR
jgi:hypothetical protein